MVDVAERDLGAIAVGQPVNVRTRSLSGRQFAGKINVIYPQVNRETRTTRVRIELTNADLALLPDMYIDASIETGSADPVVSVPESAVIDTGTRQSVFIDKGQGRFEPRRVGLGRRGGGYVEIREGVADGEPVVISANFLIDAESNLEGRVEGLFRREEPTMIARIIAWSARNLLLVLFGTGFAAAAGIYALAHLPLDAIPDLSDTQVIVYTEYPGQAPQVIEDQVTYPLTTAMLTVPKSKVVRGFSFFGVSFVYVIFEDGTDIYWARSRVLEFLNGATSRLPAGVTPTMGPDATGVGWVYQYAIMSKELNLADTRAIQDWNLKFALAKAEGVAEVASVGGFVKQYNVVLDPLRMRDLGITMQKMRDAIRASNADVGGRTVELSEFEYVIRGKGYLKSINDLGNVVLKTNNGTPVLLRDVARVELGPDERRGITELNGEGEVASGIVLQRFGVNALDVIENVKKRFKEIASSLPNSVEIVPVYDRSNLINAAIATLKHTLLEESVVVALVCILFLLHVRSALVAILMLPVGVLMAFGAMKLLGLGSNIMSLGGIAIAIGAMVDAAIVMIENAHKHLERADPGKSRVEVLIEGSLRSRPGAILQPVDHHRVVHADLHAGIPGRTSVQPSGVHQDVCDGGRGYPVSDAGPGPDDHLRSRPDRSGTQEPDQPLSDLGLPAGHQCCDAREDAGRTARTRRSRGECLAGPSARHRVRMPSLNEGTLVYMPTTLPGHLRYQGRRTAADAGQDHSVVSRRVASVYLARQGALPRRPIRRPPKCSETIINLKPKEEWRSGLTVDGLIAEMDKALQFPGVSNAWTMPIKARIDMLSTGIRTPIGVKVIGTDLVEIDRLAKQIEQVLKAGAGHIVGLCRARHRRLLPRCDTGSRGIGALRRRDPGRPGT